jgi:transposase-like protein
MSVKRKRKLYDVAFKTKVVLEAFKEQKTLAQLGSEFGVSPNQISLWKNDIIKGLPTLFGAKSTDLAPEKEEEITAPLFQQIGELQVENNFLKKKLKQLKVY